MNKPILNKTERSKIYDHIIEEFEPTKMSGTCSQYVDDILNGRANKKVHKIFWKDQLITFMFLTLDDDKLIILEILNGIYLIHHVWYCKGKLEYTTKKNISLLAS